MSDRKDITVALTQPCYGGVTAAAARGFWRATRGKATIRGEDHKVNLNCNYSEASLLAANFNICWTWALNQLHWGKRVDYFAMLHGDVEPEDHWLDKMIAEMEARDLDVLGAVVPIKDHKGLTSIALERPDKDNWRPLCRLTMKEIFRLPVTFTREDTGYPLLLNTGCWVCRFDPKWIYKVHFTINDRIVFCEPKNCYIVQVEPEDWYFSRLLGELGLKIGATRCIKIQHRGPAAFTNEHPWGISDVDREYTQQSFIPDTATPDDWFPSDVEGWLLREEGEALRKLARGKMVLEIGSYCGRSTICLAQEAMGVVSVDPHDGRATPKPKDTYGEMQENLSRHGVVDRVRIVRSSSEDLASEPTHPFDLVFIDGAHDYSSVKRDIEVAIRHLKADGLIAFHDFREYPAQHDGGWDPGVTEAVQEFLKSGAELIERHATVAVVRPPRTPAKPQEPARELAEV